jgi:hypothetical protein
MDWIPIVVLFAMIFIALWMDWKKVKSPVAWGAYAIGFIAYFLWLKGWLGNAFILMVAGLDALDHIPRWIDLMVAAVIVGYYIRFIISAFAQGLDDIALEQQKTNARIELLENSIRHKLDDIASRLPERESDYLTELQKETLRD